MIKFLKNYFKNFIKKIAEENDKSFGNGKLDCCDLNKSNNAIKKTNTENK